jgi:hypothetical protein
VKLKARDIAAPEDWCGCLGTEQLHLFFAAMEQRSIALQYLQCREDLRELRRFGPACLVWRRDLDAFSSENTPCSAQMSWQNFNGKTLTGLLGKRRCCKARFAAFMTL